MDGVGTRQASSPDKFPASLENRVRSRSRMLSTLEIHERRGSDAVILAMGVLHRAAHRAGEDGCTLSLTGPRPNVQRVLRLTNLA